jgi:hypothetical protein
MKSQPHVVPEEGRHTDSEENRDEEEEDDMVLGHSQRGGVHPEVDEVLDRRASNEGTVEQSVTQEQHEELKKGKMSCKQLSPFASINIYFTTERGGGGPINLSMKKESQM